MLAAMRKLWFGSISGWVKASSSGFDGGSGTNKRYESMVADARDEGRELAGKAAAAGEEMDNMKEALGDAANAQRSAMQHAPLLRPRSMRFRAARVQVPDEASECRGTISCSNRRRSGRKTSRSWSAESLRYCPAMPSAGPALGTRHHPDLGTRRYSADVSENLGLRTMRADARRAATTASLSGWCRTGLKVPKAVAKRDRRH